MIKSKYVAEEVKGRNLRGHARQSPRAAQDTAASCAARPQAAGALVPRGTPPHQGAHADQLRSGCNSIPGQAASAPLGRASSLAARAATCAFRRSSSSLSEAVWLPGASGWIALRAPGGAAPMPPAETRP